MGGSILTKITSADLITLGIIVAVGVSLLGFSESPPKRGKFVEIRSLKGETLTLDLAEAQDIDVEGMLGTTTIEVSAGEVRFSASPCPHKICVEKGRIARSREWIACLPNGVLARITGRADYDEITP